MWWRLKCETFIRNINKTACKSIGAHDHIVRKTKCHLANFDWLKCHCFFPLNRCKQSNFCQFWLVKTTLRNHDCWCWLVKANIILLGTCVINDTRHIQFFSSCMPQGKLCIVSLNSLIRYSIVPLYNMKYAVFEFVSDPVPTCEVGETAWIIREDPNLFDNESWDFDREVMVAWPCNYKKVAKKIVKSSVDPASISTKRCVAKVVKFNGTFFRFTVVVTIFSSYSYERFLNTSAIMRYNFTAILFSVKHVVASACNVMLYFAICH